jgi:hypothetical protein
MSQELRSTLEDIGSTLDDIRRSVRTTAAVLTSEGDEDAEEAGVDQKLSWIHDELQSIRGRVENIWLSVLAIAVATVGSVWHHW